jgi:hypothetical protein
MAAGTIYINLTHLVFSGSGYLTVSIPVLVNTVR